MLMSYGPIRKDYLTQTAVYVDKIIRGEKPRDLPIIQPARLPFILNLNTAKALGLSMPPSLLARADEVIE